MPWTINSDNYASADIATIGITGLRYTLQNGLKDTCSFFMPVDAVDDASPPFNEQTDIVTLTYGGTIQFRGYVDRCSPSALGDQEGWHVEIAGLGQLLDVCPYTQTLPITGAGTAEFSAGLVLGYNSGGTRLNLANTLADIISSTSSRHGITAGTFLSGVAVTAPLMEVTDVSVGEALRRAAAWVPDAVIYLDHSAGTLQIKKPSALSVVNRSGTADTVENSRDGRRRKVVNGVKIIWRTTTQVNGASEVSVTTDSAGTTTGPWTTIITIDLAGSNTVTQSEQVVTGTPLPSVVGDVTEAFLIEHWPELGLANPQAGELVTHAVTQTIDSSTHQGLGSLPASYSKYLKAGNIPPWQAGISAATTVVTITLRAGANFANNAALSKLFTNDEKLLKLTKTFTGTNAATTTYTNLVSYTAGDAPVTGLAADWLAALNSAAPAGTLRLVDTEPVLTIKPGTKITLSGDLDVTNGIVQAVTVDIDSGETLVTYGPQSRLTPHEFMELQRAGSRRSPLSAAPGTARTSATPASRTLKGGIGGRADSVAHKLQDTSGWFRITQTGATTVKVGPGCIHTPDWTDDEITETEWDDPLLHLWAGTIPGKYIKSIFGAASGNIAVANGDYIWVKVELIRSVSVPGPWFTGYTDDTNGTHGGTWKTTVDMNFQFITGAGLDPTGYTAAATQPADLYDGSGVTHTFVCIGQIAIAANVMTITQGQWGALFVPGYIIPDGGSGEAGDWPEPG